MTRPLDALSGLVAARRALGDGSLAGRARSATPYDREELHRGTQQAVLDVDVKGYWSRPGTRRLFVGPTQPSQPPAQHDDLWVDTAGISDTSSDLVEVTPYDFSPRCGSAAKLADGRMLYVWADATAIRQGVSPDVETYLTQSGSVVHTGNIVEDLVRADLSSGWPMCAVARDGSRLLLATFWWSRDGDEVARGRVYQSVDEAQTWQVIAEHDTLDVAGVSIFVINGTTVGPPRRLDDGSLVLCTIQALTSRLQYGETAPATRLLHSADGGATWTVRLAEPTGIVGAIHRKNVSRHVGGPDSELYWGFHRIGGPGTAGTYLFRSTDRGRNWTQANLIEGGFDDSYAVAMVAPYAPGLSGWAVVSVGWTGRVQRWLAPNPSSPLADWTEIETDFQFSGGNSTNNQVMLATHDGILTVYFLPHAGQALLAATNRASFWVLAEDGTWVLVAGAVILDHAHTEYALALHTHEGDAVDLALADLTDVEDGGVAGDALVREGDGMWRPGAPARPWHVGPDPPAVAAIGDLWVDTSGT